MNLIKRIISTLNRLLSYTETKAIINHTQITNTTKNPEKKSILDIGCGMGELFKKLLQSNNSVFKNSYSVGLDIFPLCLSRAKTIYNDVIQCDIRHLPIRDYSWNYVLASQIIEHLEKKEGLKLIQDIEKMSKETIIFAIPVSSNPKPILEHNNPWQTHKSTWYPDDFRKKGYKVYGYDGVRLLKNKKDKRETKYQIFKPILNILSLLTQIFTKRLVSASYQMICIKIKPKKSFSS